MLNMFFSSRLFIGETPNLLSRATTTAAGGRLHDCHSASPAHAIPQTTAEPFGSVPSTHARGRFGASIHMLTNTHGRRL